MEIFERLSEHDHEQIAFWSEPEVGYRGIIAIHDSSLGPAMGGTRFWDYPSEREAVVDVLRLARGMTYKAAIAGVDLGGGKSVILGDNRTTDREMIFRAHGRFVESLGGRYIAAEDVGTSVDDMDFVQMETGHVAGLHGRSGDPSPVTALGAFHALRACALEVYGDASLAGKHVVVQGVGHVGQHLCGLLADAGARLTVSDVDPERVERARDALGAEVVAVDEVFSVDADIFAPCALGGVIDDRTLPLLEVDIVAGAANNQLARPDHAGALKERGILYAPDYVVNAGGLINIYGELTGWTRDRSRARAAGIFGTLRRVFDTARSEAITPAAAADRIAEARIASVRRLHRSRV